MFINNIPAPGLVLLAILAIQIGASFATSLFPVLGADGTVAVRITLAAVLLVIVAKGRDLRFIRLFRSNWLLMLGYGGCIAAMNLFFYEAIARIPLGAAVAIEFIGPLGVAAATSRRIGHFFWVGLAVLGIVLLSPLSGANLDELGVMYALLAGTGWACFIIFTGKVVNRIPGNDGLAMGMTIAALFMIPWLIPVTGVLVANHYLLLAGLGVALLSTTIPFTLEFEALKKLSKRAYGILVSLEPAVAAVVGMVVLGERIGLQGLVAVVCVVSAAFGISVTEKRESSSQ